MKIRDLRKIETECFKQLADDTQDIHSSVEIMKDIWDVVDDHLDSCLFNVTQSVWREYDEIVYCIHKNVISRKD